MSGAGVDGFGELFPLGEEEHERQVRGVLGLLGKGPARVLDLGAGDGRVARPVAAAGHSVVAWDRDAGALSGMEGVAGVEVVEGDFEDEGAAFGGGFDAALLLGHTLMLLEDVDVAARVFERARRAVKSGGWLGVDASCVELWREVSEGYWQTGVSEDGRWQLVWLEGDARMVIRRDGEVEVSSWEVREGERVVRLWSLGALRLLARVSGWSGPVVRGDLGLVVFGGG